MGSFVACGHHLRPGGRVPVRGWWPGLSSGGQATVSVNAMSRGEFPFSCVWWGLGDGVAVRFRRRWGASL